MFDGFESSFVLPVVSFSEDEFAHVLKSRKGDFKVNDSLLPMKDAKAILIESFGSHCHASSYSILFSHLYIFPP